MKKIYSALFIVFIAALGLNAQIIDDGFEIYTAGERLATQAGDPWTTWSNAPGGAEDPFVSDEKAYAGVNSVKIASGNDCVLLLGDETTSRYKLSFYIYIPAGKLGYYNVLQDFAGANSIWGSQVWFDVGGNGSIDADGAGAATFSFNYDEWIYIENYFDLENDWAEVFVNGEYLVGWQWTLGTFGDPGPLQVSAANFYAWDGTKSVDGVPEYYLDNVVFEEMPLGQAPENLEASVEGTTVSLSWDAPASETPDSYYILRNNDLAGITTETSFEETLELPGYYAYEIKAYYSISGLSQAAGPANVEIAGGTARSRVLLEIATGTWCFYCPGSAMGADDMVEAGLDVAVIEYHNGDPYATTQSDARNNYYAVDGYPTSTFDGIDGFAGGSNTESLYPTYLSYYNPRIEVQTIFELEMNVQLDGNRANSFDVSLSTEQLWDYNSSDLRLHVVLTESHIPDNWFSLHEVNFVCREMYPDQNGTALTLENSGDTEDLSFTVEVPDTYDVNNCEIVTFIQDNNTKEVLNSTSVHLAQVVGIAEMGNLYTRIYPNPASGKTTIESEMTMKRVSIFTVTGQKVYEIALDQNKLDLNIDFLKSGLYMVQIETEQGSNAKKLFVR
ncbi:MAG TPA: T9SS type A sorting domain-containing protein [Bacteroidales bacterium]